MKTSHILGLLMLLAAVFGCYKPDQSTATSPTTPVSSIPYYYISYKLNGKDSTIWDTTASYSFASKRNASFQNYYQASTMFQKPVGTTLAQVNIQGAPDSTIKKADFEGLVGKTLQLASVAPDNSTSFSGSIDIAALGGPTLADSNMLPTYFMKIDTVKQIKTFIDPVTQITNTLYSVSGTYNGKLNSKQSSGKFRMPFTFIQY